jgi:colicin import membrane protein
MKAAADAWGLRTNVFTQGFAKETHDPAIVAATMAKPGVVLRRPVGSNGRFTEDAHLPKHLPVDKETVKPAKPEPKRKERPTNKISDKSARVAALAFEREQKRREEARRKQDAKREQERERRERAIGKVEKAIELAKRKHEAATKKIETERAALDKRSAAEDERWKKRMQKLEDALQRARQ